MKSLKVLLAALALSLAFNLGAAIRLATEPQALKAGHALTVCDEADDRYAACMKANGLDTVPTPWQPEKVWF